MDLDWDAVVARLRAAGCVFPEEETEVLSGAAATRAELDAMVERRTRGIPIPHILGWTEFCGIRISVRPDVFIPRPRSELLVREAVALVAGGWAIVVDLCCGSGALGAAVASAAGRRLQLHAADIDPVAVACARENLAPVGGQVYQGDLYAPLPEQLRGRVDVLVANVPYVPTEAIPMLPSEFRLFEPLEALDGGEDGLDVLRRLVQQAPGWLAEPGHLLVETSRGQAPAAAAVMAAAGLVPRVVRDEQLDATVVAGEHRNQGTHQGVHRGQPGTTAEELKHDRDAKPELRTAASPQPE